MARHVANQPQTGFSKIFRRQSDHRRKKCVGRLGGVIEHDLTLTGGESCQAHGEFGLSHGEPEPAVSEIVQRGHAVLLCQIHRPHKADSPTQYGKSFIKSLRVQPLRWPSGVLG